MIELRLRSPDRAVEPTLYRLADRLLAADVALPELAAFRASAGTERPPEPFFDAFVGPGEERVFRGEAPLGGTSRDVDCRWTAPGYALSVAGIGTFRVSGDGRAVHGEPEDTATADAVAETVLGPALILALALQGVWCLHASAVAAAGRAAVFVGESGAGKSTLAAELPAAAPPETPLRPLADDVLPVTLAAAALAAPGARVLPHFPQLKYAPDRQPGAGAPTALPLAVLYVLDTSPAGAGGVAVEELGEADALLALVRHTIASRLFTAALLRRHVDFCAALAGRVPVRRLRYPRSRDTLPRVAAAVAADLGSSPAAPAPDPSTIPSSATGPGRRTPT